MRKAKREIERLAADLGILDAHVIEQKPHARLIGTVNGKPISIVVTLTKAMATKRMWLGTKCNIRRAVREMQQ